MSNVSFNRREMLKMSAFASAAAFLNFNASQHSAKAQTRPASANSMIQLSRNENPYGPSPRAKQAIIEAVAGGNRYASDEISTLERMIAEREGLLPENVVLATGFGEILAMAAVANGLDKGEIVAADPTFDWMLRYAESLGSKINKVPLNANYAHDLSEMSRRVSSATKLIYVCNPNSPTATIVPGSQLRQFCEDAGKRAAGLVDEAYIEYLDDFPASSMVDLVRKGANVIVSRTFSKLYGLAGLRVGYGLARKDVAENLRKYRMTWLNPISLRAAIASLEDTDFARESRRKNAETRKYVLAEMDKLKLVYAPSHANFFGLNVGAKNRDLPAKLAKFNIRVGSANAAPLTTDWARVTIGTMEEMKAFVEALKKIQMN